MKDVENKLNARCGRKKNYENFQIIFCLFKNTVQSDGTLIIAKVIFWVKLIGQQKCVQSTTESH
jgi:hypothetical protein